MPKKVYKKTFVDGTQAIMSVEHEEESGFSIDTKFPLGTPQVSIVEAFQEFKRTSLEEFFKVIDPKGEKKFRSDVL